MIELFKVSTVKSPIYKSVWAQEKRNIENNILCIMSVSE